MEITLRIDIANSIVSKTRWISEIILLGYINTEDDEKTAKVNLDQLNQ